MAGIAFTNVLPQKAEYKGSRKCERFNGTCSAPTVLAGTGAGSATGGTATLSADATDARGQLTVINGTTSVAAGTIAVITLANTLNRVYTPILTPTGGSAPSLLGATIPISVGGSTTYVFNLGAGATLTSLATYVWNYEAPDSQVAVTLNTIYVRQPTQVVWPGYTGATFTTPGTVSLTINPNFQTGLLEVQGDW